MDELNTENTTREEVAAFLKKHDFPVCESDNHETLLAISKLVAFCFPGLEWKR